MDKRFQNPFFKTSYDHNSKDEEIRTQLDPNFDAVRTRRDINPTFINYDDFFRRKTSQPWLSKDELAKKEQEMKERRKQTRDKILKNRELRRSKENIEKFWIEHKQNKSVDDMLSKNDRKSFKVSRTHNRSYEKISDFKKTKGLNLPKN